ncbi:GDSL esterase/lipase At3g27950-like [Impatiens glandulifera]|uniref:GDSL esterase/lipase At3g27950-like n=1 Tax=Impatiens glandulifera TaxID=253017 RepID=UPI001FB19303|nr:GDSL esterase/lipase At3g27950-like [Impatiens glandulifera]
MPMRITDAEEEEGLYPINEKTIKIKGSLRIIIMVMIVGVVGLLLAHDSINFATLRETKDLSIKQTNAGCQFPAIFNFGDSNSDTGTESAAFGRLPLPFGQTFFGKPSGRRCDGRLIIDFIAERLRMPYLSAYLDSIGSNFRHGSNFASSGSSIMEMPCTNQLLDLGTQLRQFQQFKQRIAESHHQGGNWLYLRNFLPRRQDFSKALYIIDSGQNDLYYALKWKTEKQVKANIPNIIDHIGLVIETLYQEGARIFWIHNTGPIGCLPIMVKNNPPKHGNSDQNGCLVSYNELAKDFNSHLLDKIIKLRTQIQDALIIYVDIYSAKYSLINQAKKLGFMDPLQSCCEPLKGGILLNEIENKRDNVIESHGSCCSNPSEYIAWDSIHYTEAANQWVANFIMSGSFSDPPIAVTEAACANQTRGTQNLKVEEKQRNARLGSFLN